HRMRGVARKPILVVLERHDERHVEKVVNHRPLAWHGRAAMEKFHSVYGAQSFDALAEQPDLVGVSRPENNYVGKHVFY
ncbi:hypothetical protein OSL60_27920, partial [Escherichia coli]|nr:hypothetical protein [Escherichia coli]